MSDDVCGFELGSLYCGEPPHDGEWHYDQYDDVTFRAGRHLPDGTGGGGDQDAS